MGEKPGLSRRHSSMPVVKSGEVAWFSPKEKGNKPGPRSGHTITCAQEKAILFGGCGVGEGQSAVFNDTYVLHIADNYRWEKIDAMGDLPLPRWRHTATILPDNNSIFVFGGLCKGKRFNDSHVYDIARREWSLKEVRWRPPALLQRNGSCSYPYTVMPHLSSCAPFSTASPHSVWTAAAFRPPHVGASQPPTHSSHLSPPVPSSPLQSLPPPPFRPPRSVPPPADCWQLAAPALAPHGFAGRV